MHHYGQSYDVEPEPVEEEPEEPLVTVTRFVGT